MPNAVEEQEVNILESQKRANVENAILSNPVFQELQKTLANFPEIKINIDDMIDSYMDQSGGLTLNDDISIDYGTVDEVIKGTIYSISREENGVVLESNGQINLEETIKSRMMAQYTFVRGIENLTPEQLRSLSSSLGEVLDIDSLTSATNTINEVAVTLFSLKSERITELDRIFFDNINSGNITKEIIEVYLSEKTKELNITSESKQRHLNNFISDRDELALITAVVRQNLAKLKGEGHYKTEFEDALVNLNKEQFLDSATGEKNQKAIDEAIKKGEDWLKNRLELKRIDAFIDYTNNRKKGMTFEKLTPEAQKEIFGAALLMIKDTSAPEKYQNLAGAILLDIHPALVTGKDENRKIDTNIVKNLYEVYFGDGKTNIGDIMNEFQVAETGKALDKLVYLSNKENWKSPEEYEKIVADREIAAEKLQESLEKLSKKKEGSLIVAGLNMNKRLMMRLKENFSQWEKDGKDVNETATIIAAYIELKKSTVLTEGMDLGNIKINSKAVSLLEKYILDDPVRFANIIQRDEEGNQKINISKDQRQYYTNEKKESIAKLRPYIDQVKKDTQRTASELVYRKSSLRDQLLTRDGVEILATAIKDGVKFFIKQGLKATIGEDKTNQLAASVRGNKAYKATRSIAYSALGLSYKGIKGVTKFLATPVTAVLNRLPNSTRLALKSGENSVSLADVNEIIEDAENKNLIKSTTELDLIAVGVDYDLKDDEEKKEAGALLVKLPGAAEYKDERGNIVGLKEPLDKGRQWRDRYSNQMRAQTFLKFSKALRMGQKFESLGPEIKNEILRAAFSAIKLEGSSQDMKQLAAGVLVQISPEIVKSVNKDNVDINFDKFMDVYRKIDGNEKMTEKKLTYLYQYEEATLAKEKLASIRENLAAKEKRESRRREQSEYRTNRIYGKTTESEEQEKEAIVSMIKSAKGPINFEYFRKFNNRLAEILTTNISLPYNYFSRNMQIKNQMQAGKATTQLEESFNDRVKVGQECLDNIQKVEQGLATNNSSVKTQDIQAEKDDGELAK